MERVNYKDLNQGIQIEFDLNDVYSFRNQQTLQELPESIKDQLLLNNIRRVKIQGEAMLEVINVLKTTSKGLAPTDHSLDAMRYSIKRLEQSAKG